MNKKIIKSEIIHKEYLLNEHPSGLKILLYPMKGFSSNYAIFGTKYGSVDNAYLDDDGKRVDLPEGIAHFLEHKLFECEGGIDAFELYAKTGANANAFTTNTLTAYIFSCTENFYGSLEILLDFVTHPYFTEKTVQKEQGIIGQEIRMYDDHPGARLNKGLLQALYKKNKMRIDVAGTIESIAQIDASVLYKCYETFYNLNNMALCICGDVDVDSVEAVCDKILEKAKKRKGKKKKSVRKERERES